MANYEEFMDPNSAIARIIAQMQGAARRSDPNVIDQRQLQGDLRPGGAQPPVGEMQYPMAGVAQGEMDPQELIQQLLANQ